MNRRTLLSAAAAAILAAGSFSASAAPVKELKIAATPVPQGEVLKFVKPILAKEGIDLKIFEFSISPSSITQSVSVISTRSVLRRSTFSRWLFTLTS